MSAKWGCYAKLRLIWREEPVLDRLVQPCVGVYSPTVSQLQTRQSSRSPGNIITTGFRDSRNLAMITELLNAHPADGDALRSVSRVVIQVQMVAVGDRRCGCEFHLNGAARARSQIRAAIVRLRKNSVNMDGGDCQRLQS